MGTKFVLTQLIPRANTTDTSIIAVSDTAEKLEEYINNIVKMAKESHDDEEYLNYFSDTFSIIEVQYVG